MTHTKEKPYQSDPFEVKQSFNTKLIEYLPQYVTAGAQPGPNTRDTFNVIIRPEVIKG